MPGLTLVLDHHTRQDLGDRFNRLAAASVLVSGYRQESWADPSGRLVTGRADLGIFNTESQPIVSRNGRYHVCFQGDLLDRELKLEALALRGVPLTGRDNPDLLLATYLADGERGIEALNGSFFFTLWDQEQGRLLVGNDRYANRAHYYSFHDGRLLIAPMVAGVLAGRGDCPALSIEGIAEFLALEHPLAERTLFEAIKAFPAGSFLTVTRDASSLRTYWTPQYTGGDESVARPESEWLDEATRLFRQAVQRTMTGRFCLPLSGGTDSRTIAAFADRQDFPTYTFGAESSDDVRIGRQIAGALGLKHHFMALQDDYMVRHADDIIGWGDGMMSLFHAHNRDGTEEVAAIAPVSLYGMNAEFYRMEAVDNVLAVTPRSAAHKVGILARHVIDGRRPLAHFADKAAVAARIRQVVWNNLTPALAQEALAPEFAAAMIAAVTQTLNQQLMEVTAHSPEDHYATFNVMNRQRRFTAMGIKVAGFTHEFRKPFDDYDLVDFMLRTPAATRRRLINRVICQANPAIAAIPRTGSGTSISASFVERAAAYARKEVNKAFHPGRVQSFADPQTLLRTTARSFYEQVLLDPGTLHNGYFNPQGLTRLVQRHMAGELDIAGALCALATFELWRRRFVVGAGSQKTDLAA